MLVATSPPPPPPTSTGEDSAKHPHRLRERGAARSRNTTVAMALDRQRSSSRRHSRSRRRTAGAAVEGRQLIDMSSANKAELNVANAVLKFKQKRQSMDQLLNIHRSQSTSTAVLFLVSSFVAVLLLNGHIVPVGAMSIAAVTNEPPLALLLSNRTSSSAASARGGEGGAAAMATATTSPGAIPSPIIRLPSNSLIKYTAYRDVSILHFQVPRDSRTLYYSFRAHEEFKSAFCK